MKYLVTGGCGFLGSNIAAELLSRGEDVIIFDNMSRFGSSMNLNWLMKKAKFEFVHGDVRLANDVERLVQRYKPDVIFHLAGQVAMTTSITDPRMDFETNALGSFNVLNSVRVYSPDSSILYSSTNKVYGDLEQYAYIEQDTRYVCKEFPNGFDESIPLDFHSPYGTSKGSADQYMLDFSRIYGLKTSVFRHSSMYGGRQFSTFDQGWLGWFATKALEIHKGELKEEFTISGNGKQVRDLLYADDMVRLYISAAEQIDKISGQAFNIGGGIDNSSSLLELFKFLEQELKIKMVYKKLPPRESDQKVFVADISKVSSILGWKPQMSKEDGILKMLEWIKEQ